MNYVGGYSARTPVQTWLHTSSKNHCDTSWLKLLKGKESLFWKKLYSDLFYRGHLVYLGVHLGVHIPFSTTVQYILVSVLFGIQFNLSVSDLFSCLRNPILQSGFAVSQTERYQVYLLQSTPP